PCLATFAEQCHLAASVADDQVAPLQAGDLANPSAAGVQQTQQHVVAPCALFPSWRAAPSWWLLRGDEEFVDVAFGQDPLGQRVFEPGTLYYAADVEAQLAQAVAEAEQRFD